MYYIKQYLNGKKTFYSPIIRPTQKKKKKKLSGRAVGLLLDLDLPFLTCLPICMAISRVDFKDNYTPGGSLRDEFSACLG